MANIINIVQILFTLGLAMLHSAIAAGQNENLLNIQTPTFFAYNSPLSQPNSLRSRPYFDFLSTLYRHDPTKTDLFRPYLRSSRDVTAASAYAASNEGAPETPAIESEAELALASSEPHHRQKRMIVFRPLFVYRQEQVKRQKLAEERRRRVYY